VCIRGSRVHSKNGLNPRPSEGEGAYSTEGARRSHLPLRGKLGWMTPRTGQKKTGKVGMHSSGAPVPKQGPPIFFRASLTR
jgi:hypothetical protein